VTQEDAAPHASDHHQPVFPLVHLRDVGELELYINNITCFERSCFISKGLAELEMLIVEWCEPRKIDLIFF